MTRASPGERPGPKGDLDHRYVTIAGKPETNAVGRDIIGSARHVEGVVTVRDSPAAGSGCAAPWASAPTATRQ
jgi:hypothetical protein